MATKKKGSGPKQKIDWEKMKQEYVTSNPKKSYRELAEKYVVNCDYVRQRATREHWVAARKEFMEEVSQRAHKKIAENRSNILARADKAAEVMMAQIEECLSDPEQFKRHLVVASAPADSGLGTISTTYEQLFEKRDTKSMKDIIQMLKEVKAMCGGQTQTEKDRHALDREKFEHDKEMDIKRFEWEKQKAIEKSGHVDGDEDRYGVVLMPELLEVE